MHHFGRAGQYKGVCAAACAQRKSPLRGGLSSVETQKLQGTEMLPLLADTHLIFSRGISRQAQSIKYRSTLAFKRPATVAATTGESIAAPLSMYVQIPSGSTNAATIPYISPVLTRKIISSSASTSLWSPLPLLSCRLITLLSFGYIVFQHRNAITVSALRHRGFRNPTKHANCLLFPHVEQIDYGVDLVLGQLQQLIEHGLRFRMLRVGNVGLVEPAVRLAHSELKTTRDFIPDVAESAFPNTLRKIRLGSPGLFCERRKTAARLRLKNSHVHLA